MIEIIVMLFVILGVVGVALGGYFYVKGQITSVKKYVKTEIKKLVDTINDAQYNEFNFDKQNELNIRRLEKQLVDLVSKVDTILAAK